MNARRKDGTDAIVLTTHAYAANVRKILMRYYNTEELQYRRSSLAISTDHLEAGKESPVLLRNISQNQCGNKN